MIRYIFLISVMVGLLAVSVLPAVAQMSSTSYRIPTTVMSAGGGPMGSANFQLNGTLGQPSPLIDPLDPPWSTHYDLLSGFWYTTGNALPFSLCPADFQPDGRVDGDDLAILAASFGQAVVGQDVDGDLDMDGMDLWEMAADFNRTDCFP